MRDPRIQKLADVLVNYSVAVKPGQLVCIKGETLAQPLVVELYRSILAAGGNAIVRMAPEELEEILVKQGSDEQLKFLDPVKMFEIEKIDGYIGIWAEENTKNLSNADAKRVGMQQATRKPWLETLMKRAATGTL